MYRIKCKNYCDLCFIPSKDVYWIFTLQVVLCRIRTVWSIDFSATWKLI